MAGRRSPGTQLMATRAIDVVIFDLDGTLVDTAPDLAAALNHTLGVLGRLPVALAQVRHLAGDGTRALLQHGLALTGEATADLVERGVPIFLDHYEAHICDRSVPADGIEDALAALAEARIRLGICTNKPERLARKLVARLGWQARFAAIVGGDTLGVSKPDPRPLQRCVENCGGGTAVFVGDSLVDRATARAAGLPFIAAVTGFGSNGFTCGDADAVIGSFAAFVPALEQLG